MPNPHQPGARPGLCHSQNDQAPAAVWVAVRKGDLCIKWEASPPVQGSALKKSDDPFETPDSLDRVGVCAGGRCGYRHMDAAGCRFIAHARKPENRRGGACSMAPAVARPRSRLGLLRADHPRDPRLHCRKTQAGDPGEITNTDKTCPQRERILGLCG